MSRAGSANRTWVQIHLGEEPADAGGTREFVSLPHPRTGKDCRYMRRGESVLELQMAKPPEGRGSWFIGDLVKQDGSVQLVSEIDPIFLVAPLLATASAHASAGVGCGGARRNAVDDDFPGSSDFRLGTRRT